MTCTHHYSIRNSFTALTMLHALLIHLCLLSSPGNYCSFYCLHSFAHKIGIIQLPVLLKVVLDHSHMHLHFVYFCTTRELSSYYNYSIILGKIFCISATFALTASELSSCYRDWSTKPNNIYYPTLYRKFDDPPHLWHKIRWQLNC